MARYKNKWAELPPPPINPRRWGFDPKKGWSHAVSPAFRKAYTESRLEQLEIEEGPLKEDDLVWLNDDQAFVPHELLQEIEEEMDSEDFSDVGLYEHAELRREVLDKMDIEAAFAALTA